MPAPSKPGVPAEIIPPDPAPPDPDREPTSDRPPTKRDRRQQSSPDLADKRRLPRTPDPPIVISRRSSRFDSTSTHSVGPAGLAGYDLLLLHDR